MYQFASLALIHCGASQVVTPNDGLDPTTEEEFASIQYVSDKKITWNEYLQAIDAVKIKYGMKVIRNEREKLLKESDWIMTVDNIDTLENKDEWIKYRQILRDSPELFTNYIWISFPNKLDLNAMGFPNKPNIIRKK